jgi:hypothetical protein
MGKQVNKYDAVLFRNGRRNKAIRREMRQMYRNIFSRGRNKSVVRLMMRRFRRRRRTGRIFSPEDYPKIEVYIKDIKSDFDVAPTIYFRPFSI